jgi:hypothetical protein
MSMLVRILLLSLLAGGLLWGLLQKESTETAVDQKQQFEQELKKVQELQVDRERAREDEVEKLKD